MYFAKINPEDRSKYNEIVVNGRSFYYLKESSTKEVKKKYFDTISNPKFKEADLYRKLNMVNRFKKDVDRIDSLIDKYLDCIRNSLYILEKEFSMPPKFAFKAFKLKKLGIDPSDYSIDEESSSESFEE